MAVEQTDRVKHQSLKQQIESLPLRKKREFDSLVDEYLDNKWLLTQFKSWMQESNDSSKESVTNLRYLDEKDKKLIDDILNLLCSKSVVTERNKNALSDHLEIRYGDFIKTRADREEDQSDTEVKLNELIPRNGFILIRPSLSTGNIQTVNTTRFPAQ
jgi:hypothetical protein